jgi:hypothetical protein
MMIMLSHWHTLKNDSLCTLRLTGARLRLPVTLGSSLKFTLGGCDCGIGLWVWVRSRGHCHSLATI